MIDIYNLHAEICKTLASPVRLKIINTLRDKKLSAGDLIKKLNINKVSLSQHMTILVQKGVVISERAGKKVFYQLRDTEIIKACDIMRNVLIKYLEQNKNILKKIK
ncbi:MAG: metalloregulator ArsR/SmtB family transcription factor [Elusimicrobia bacterium]|nr:metalloregulator ArsR/SmtB family transcription factor [Elusimicrobiota bacterium]